MGLFGRKDAASEASTKGRAPRTSSGWRDVLASLHASEGQRVLDFGATSPSNINFLTSLGHSVYSSQIVQDAAGSEWTHDPDGTESEFRLHDFAAEHLTFSDKVFDVVLLWDTANYLPKPVPPVLFARLGEVLRPGGLLLAFAHGGAAGAETDYVRYHLTDTPELLQQPAGNYRLQNIYQTRQIEQWLKPFASTRFFLGKDNIREVIAVR